MRQNKTFTSNKIYLNLFLFMPMSLVLTACNTVDKTAYADATCGELKALAESFDSQASQHTALLNDTTEFSRRNQERDTQDQLLNTSRSSSFKQRSAIRSAYKKGGC